MIDQLPERLRDMTQTRWDSLTPAQRNELRDNSCLSPQLKRREGWRVEVINMDGTKRRFIVGLSTGWRPVHLEIATRRSLGGFPACREYKSVKALELVR